MTRGARSVFFATCAPGIEAVLHGEARALRLERLERQVGGVRFEGTSEASWRANLELRTAVRVLQRLSRYSAREEGELYAGAAAVPWERFLRPDGTLAVAAQTRESRLDHSRFIEQRVKDAVVDRFRAKRGSRPSVDRVDPDLRIHVHLFRDRATLSLDTSGEPLHKRGWRRHQGRAPLAETLAAAIVLLSGWDRRAPLVDPFCGSGTIAIEAAWIALGLAPGSLRTFGFERWLDHDDARYRAFRAARARPVARPRRLNLVASDSDPTRIEEARANAESAGVADRIRFESHPATELRLRPGWNAWIATNPPHGQRLGQREDLLELYRELGARLRSQGQGCTLALLSGDRALSRALGLRGLRRIPLENGGLPCELLLGRI